MGLQRCVYAACPDVGSMLACNRIADQCSFALCRVIGQTFHCNVSSFGQKPRLCHLALQLDRRALQAALLLEQKLSISSCYLQAPLPPECLAVKELRELMLSKVVETGNAYKEMQNVGKVHCVCQVAFMIICKG